MHAQFEMIHPFVDGNGRIGRLLVALLLVSWGRLREPLLCLSAYLAAHRAEYYDRLLGISQRGDWDSWVRFFLEAVRAQARQVARSQERLGALREEMRAALPPAAMSGHAAEALELLFENPITTAGTVAGRLGVSLPTALRAIGILEEAGILTETTGRQRKRRFRADRILQALEEISGA